MSRFRVLWHLLRADFLERVRRYSFLLTLAFAVWIGWTVAAGHMRLWIGDARGIYNSAWIGTTMALVMNTFLTLAGFYIVKNAVDRDRRTGVGQILATTPMTRPLYVLGKAMSNLAVLSAMVVVLMGAAVAAQLLAGEETRVNPGALLSPFILLVLPAMALVAAIAVLFEALPWLRGGFGNIVWFFVWTASMPGAILANGAPDPVGIGVVYRALQQAAAAALGPADRGISLGVIIRDKPPQIFRWEGLEWNAELVLGRLLWVAVALGISLLAALFFDRFDPARGRVREPRRKQIAPANGGTEDTRLPLPPDVPAVSLTPVPRAGRSRFRFGSILLAELRLALKGQRWWWYAGAAGLFIATLAAPLPQVRQIVLPLAWIWPILIWSALGTREARHDTAGLVFSAAHPLGRQLPATWLAGVLLALATGSGVAIRLLAAGEMAGLGGWLVGALFIPTFALALGVWSGTSKLFEALYLLLWYIGPMNRTPQMDYLGATDQGLATGMPVVFLGITALLGAAAVAGRRWQMGR